MQKELGPIQQLENQIDNISRIKTHRESLVDKIGTDKVWVGFQAKGTNGAALDKVIVRSSPEATLQVGKARRNVRENIASLDTRIRQNQLVLMSEFVKTGDLTEDDLRHHRQELEELEKAQEGRPPEEKPRQPRQKHTVEVLSGNPASLPRVSDLTEGKTQYLTLKAVLGDELWRRYCRVFRAVIRDANSQLVVLSYVRSIYVASDQKELLRETVSEILPVLEEKRKEYLQRVAETSRRKGAPAKGALQPDNIGVLVENIRTKYNEGEPILYRADKFKELCGMSSETIHLIIRLAQRDKVIPFLPKRETGRFSYTREEMILALNHAAKLWQEGKSIFIEGKKARQERKTRTGLTLKETAKRLGVPIKVFVAWIKEGKISSDSDLKEKIERISNYYESKQRLIDPELLESEDVKKLVQEKVEE